MSADRPGLEIFTWTEPGYQPLVFHGGWQTALLNWEPACDLANAGEIERHNRTDEVFVLVKGRGALITVTTSGVAVMDMQPGAVYNVTRATWHALLSTRDAAWVIVEDRDTHLNDCEFRRMSQTEMELLRANLPDWIKE